jgi:DNA-binding NtrC family response regulator
MASCVLIVDTRRGTCGALATALGHDGFEVDFVADENEAVERGCYYDVVLVDLTTSIASPGVAGAHSPPEGRAGSIVQRLKARSPATEIVLLAPATGVDQALHAVDQGAFDFVLEPYFPDDVSLTVACAAERRRGTRIGSALAFVRKNAELLR